MASVDTREYEEEDAGGGLRKPAASSDFDGVETGAVDERSWSCGSDLTFVSVVDGAFG